MSRQHAFRAALFDAAAPHPAGLTDGQGRPAGRRYVVYRNNVASSLREALEASFPTIRALVGPDNFAHIAGAFLRASPPDSPILATYGAGFDAFLSALPALSKMGYLADIARLDLAMRQSYHAADAPHLDPARLAGLDETALQTAHFTFAPSARLVPSAWPIVSIRNYALVPGSPKPPASAQAALVLRPGFDPEPHPLPPTQAKFVQSLMRGDAFGTALALCDDDLALGPLLDLLLRHGALTDITFGKTEP